MKRTLLVLTALIFIHRATGKTVPFDFNKGFVSGDAKDQVLTADNGTCITRKKYWHAPCSHAVLRQSIYHIVRTFSSKIGAALFLPPFC